MKSNCVGFLLCGALLLNPSSFRSNVAVAQNRRLTGGIFGQVGGQQNAPEKSQPKSHPILTTPALASRVQKSLVIITTQDSHGDAVALGSGFFLTPELVATNLHVLKRSSQAIVKSALDRIPHPVKDVAAFSLIHDVCVLYVPGAAGTPISVSGSPVHIGDEILVAGNPEGLEATVSKGIVSAIRSEGHLIQIDAPISPGSSGGPVVNQRGEVVGLAVSSLVSGQNLNFAVPAHYLADETIDNVVSVAIAGHLALTDREMDGFNGRVRSYSEKNVKYRFDSKTGKFVELPAVLVSVERLTEAGEVEEIDHFDHGTQDRKTEFFYSDKGLIAKRIRVRGSGQPEVKNYSVPEAIQAQIARIHYDETQAVGKDTDQDFHLIKYDPQGNLIELNSPNSREKELYQNDENGRIKEVLVYRSDELVSKSRATYVTNEYGDWTKCTGLRANLKADGSEFRPFTDIYRELTYY
jgi:hypothetical protein